MSIRGLHLLVALALASAGGTVALAACGGGNKSSTKMHAAMTWPRILDEAHGQTVRWYVADSDPKLNAYIDRRVAPAARRFGVTIDRVAVSAPRLAVGRVQAAHRAGKTSGGDVDLIWLNGTDFSTGKRQGLWVKRWTPVLPNLRYVKTGSPLIAKDYQVPVDGQESPWNRAGFVFAFDTKRTKSSPVSLSQLLAYAKARPGRVTYPAPPDPTGAAFLRQVIVHERGLPSALAYLEKLKPYLYKRGRTYPKSEKALNELFAKGRIDFGMSYNADFVYAGVKHGDFPKSARPFVMRPGALQSTSYVTIPANAQHIAGAEVVANLLLDPALQVQKADPKGPGIPTVLKGKRIPPRQLAIYRKLVRSTYVLDKLGAAILEPSAATIKSANQAWERKFGS
jgi:ABC-type uncharacterized transport system YnjBCD substrate-binding protein